MVLYTRTYTKKCSDLHLMPPCVIQNTNPSSRALTSSSQGEDLHNQAASLGKGKKWTSLTVEHIGKSVNSKSTKIQLYFSQAVTKLGRYMYACTRGFGWDFLVTGLHLFHSHSPFSCTEAYWPSLIIIFFGSEREPEFHLIVHSGLGTGQSCLRF